MKNFKKGLVVLVASLFVSCVFADTTTTTTALPANGKVVSHCKTKCHKKTGKCFKKCMHKVVKKTTVAKKADVKAVTTAAATPVAPAKQA